MTFDVSKNSRRRLAGSALFGSVALGLALLTCNVNSGSAQDLEVTSDVAPSTDSEKADAATAPLRTEIMKFDGWSVTCQYGQDGSKAGCAANLRVNQQGTGRGLLNWSIGRAADGQLVQSVQTLSGVQIAPGVRLKAGPKEEMTLPYVSCGNAECAAAGPLKADFLRKAEQVQSIAVVVRALDGKDYTFTFSASGLPQAVAAVQGK